MEEGYTQQEKIVGLFFVALIALFILALMLIGREKGLFIVQATYYVEFAEGHNLQVGSLVKMLDTEIGKVTKIEIDVQLHPVKPLKVWVEILGNYTKNIRGDSKATVVSLLLPPTVYLDITPGNPNREPIGYLQRIPTGETWSMTENLANLVNKENIQQITTMLTNLGQMSEQLKNDEKSFLTAVDAFKQVWVQLNEGKGTLGQLVVNRDLYVRINESVNQLNKASTDAQKFTGEINKSIRVDLEKLNTIMANIERGSGAFPGLMETATETLRASKNAVETATETLQASKEVVEALKANPLIRLTSPKQPQSQPLHVEPRDVP